jgi:putative membrane protein
MRLPTIAAFVCCVVAASPAHGAGHGHPDPTERFLEQAAGRSLAGMELSDLALQRSGSAVVRRLARRTVVEESQVYEALLGLATGAGTTVVLPDTLDLEQRGIKSRLASLGGAEFDRAYVQALRTNEDRGLALYRAYVHDGKDAVLTTWAADRLRAIRRRQQLAEAAALEITGSH